jgi:hypothetical protein
MNFMSSRFSSLLQPRSVSLLALCALLAAPFAVTARAEDAAPAPFSKVHGLLQLEFSNAYITPRGLLVENQGLVIQPLLLLFWDLYASDKGVIDDVTLTTGIWNSVHTHRSGVTPGRWNEFDPFAGLTFKFEKQWQFDIFYTGFISETNTFTTSTNLDAKLTYHDAPCSVGISLNPYVEYFQELTNKATIPLGGTEDDTGFYFQLGATPTYTVPGTKVKLELPTYVSLVSSNFYHRTSGADGGSGVGLFSTELKATVPLSIPASYGFWSAYAGVQYYHLVNKGLLDGNAIAGASGSADRDLYQVHAGVTVFF